MAKGSRVTLSSFQVLEETPGPKGHKKYKMIMTFEWLGEEDRIRARKHPKLQKRRPPLSDLHAFPLPHWTRLRVIFGSDLASATKPDRRPPITPLTFPQHFHSPNTQAPPHLDRIRFPRTFHSLSDVRRFQHTQTPSHYRKTKKTTAPPTTQKLGEKGYILLH